MEITGPLVCRIRRTIKDKYGKCYGFVLLEKDKREVILLTAYNVRQKTPAGDNTLHAQQTSLYLLDREVDPNLRKLFICELFNIITTTTTTTTTKENQNIILITVFLGIWYLRNKDATP